METTTKDICEILGFKVTCFIHTQDGSTTKVYYAIRNYAGEVVSKKYNSVIEPMEVLREIENQVCVHQKHTEAVK